MMRTQIAARRSWLTFPAWDVAPAAPAILGGLTGSGARAAAAVQVGGICLQRPQARGQVAPRFEVDLVQRVARARPHRRIRRSTARSEERRVGKECRSRWSPYP